MPQRRIPTVHMRAGSTRNVAVDFGPADTTKAGLLDNGESLTGNVTVTDAGSTGNLTIDGCTTNSGNLSVNGRTCSAGQAVQFRVAAPADTEGTYTLTINVGTNATTPGAQTFNEDVTLVVE